jgi:hypothetical protein
MRPPEAVRPHAFQKALISALIQVMHAIALSVLFAGLVNLAQAQDNERAAQQHGQTRTAGPYLLDLRADGREIAIRVSDHSGQPIDTAGGKGKAVVHSDGRAVTIELHPAAPNLLSGRGRYRLNRASVVYVTVDLKKERPHRAIFRPLSESRSRR